VKEGEKGQMNKIAPFQCNAGHDLWFSNLLKGEENE
jgi:hypothetical protein